MYTQDDILNFIYNFKHRVNKEKELEDVFLNGNCYYFAIILKHRFPNMHIVYSQIDNHFMCLYDNRIYDIRGDITNNVMVCDLFSWEDYMYYDKLDYGRVVKYCVNLENQDYFVTIFMYFS